MNENDRRRRDNLLAGLNDAPSALTGWAATLENGYDAGSAHGRPWNDAPLTRRTARLDRAWWALKGGEYAERVRTDQRERYRALTGRSLPDGRLRRTPASPLERFAEALSGIADAFSRVVVPRVPLADPTQDDLTKGA